MPQAAPSQFLISVLITVFPIVPRSYSTRSIKGMDQSQSDIDSDVNTIFTDNGSESDPSDSELSSEGLDDNESDSDKEFYNNEG